jgi:hypothetical protein
MQIKVVRREFTEKSTIGELFIDNNFFCYTLEDKVRAETEEKVYGQTAIPKGKYEVIVNYSNRFKQQMPLLLNVKGFEGIRIHKGNTDVDTHGCLLLGKSKSKDFIGLSNVAYNEFMMMLKKATKGEKITIEIV